jgi:hypothetical protein
MKPMGKSLTVAVALGTSALIAGVLVTGCNYGAAAFRCNDDPSCGAGRHCELAHGAFCSVDDASCASGRRFVDLAGAQSNQCVGDDQMPPDAAPGIDAAPIDTALPPDAPPLDARVCFGGASLTICLQSAPTGTRNFSSNTTLDTGNAANCAATTSITPFGDYCVVTAATINVSATLRGTGTRPLVLIASDTINVPGGGKIDVNSHSATDAGAGADPGGGCAGGTAPSAPNGGGAGGSFTAQGGKGGDGGNGSTTTVNNTGGTPGNPVQPPITLLRGGCRGQDGQGTTGGAGGRGGGAVYLIAGTKIDVAGDISAIGGGGRTGGTGTGGALGGGGGGGAGGMIGLDAPTISVRGHLVANGGGGGEGSNQGGLSGGNGGETPTGGQGIGPAQGGTSNLNSAGDGGDGSAEAVSTGQPGAVGLSVNGNGIGGGGGGGGGAGLIKNPTGVSLGTLVSPSATP